MQPDVQVPASGFDNWFVQGAHVELVKTSHVHVVRLDNVWPGDVNVCMTISVVAFHLVEWFASDEG